MSLIYKIIFSIVMVCMMVYEHPLKSFNDLRHGCSNNPSVFAGVYIYQGYLLPGGDIWAAGELDSPSQHRVRCKYHGTVIQYILVHVIKLLIIFLCDHIM